MKKSEYEAFVLESDFTQKPFVYAALGLAGENGELIEIVKKLQRPGAELTEEIRRKALLEAGDVLWYLVRLLKDFGYTLDEVMIANVDKLKQRRAERGR